MTESKLDDAARWLWNYLKNGQKLCGNRIRPKPGTVYGEGIRAGHSGMTIRNASDKLKVQRKKVNKRWYWSLPKGCKQPKPAVVPQTKSPVRRPKRRRRRLVITIAFE